MNSWLRHDMVLRFISLAIAILMWWSISYSSLPFTKEDEYSVKLQDVSVGAKYDTDEFELRTRTDKVNITLMGNKYILDNLPLSSYRVFVNLQNRGAGIHRRVPIQVEGLPINIRKEIHPSFIDIELEKKIEKEVPVQAELIGQAAEGYRVGIPTTNPGKVVMRGVESKLNKVALVRALVYLTGATQSIQKSVKLEAYNSDGSIEGVGIYPDTVDIKIPIEPLSKKVPLRIRISKEPPKGFMVGKIKLSKEAILVYGSRSFLDQLMVYEGNELDLSKITSTTTFHLPVLRRDNALKVDPNQVVVTVEVFPVA